MAIKKQEFYEGAALHLLARTGQLTRIKYEAPFFHMNDRLFVLLKYSTKNRSPWGFTFTPEEQRILGDRAARSQTAIGLICGADGVAAFLYAAFAAVALARTGTIHIACSSDDSSSPAPFAKIFPFSPDPNQIYIPRRPAPHEGRFAIVTDVGCGMRWTRRRAREGIAGRVFP